MRASTAVAILTLAAGVAPSVARPLPAIISGRAPQKTVRPLPVPPDKPLPPLPARPDMPLVPLRRPEEPAPEPAKPKPLPPVPKAAISEVFKSAVSTGIATGIIASSNAIGQPPSRRELLERFDEQIKLAARAYVRELLATPVDDLD